MTPEQFFEEATRIDPAFAMAWGALALNRAWQAFLGLRPHDELLAGARVEVAPYKKGAGDFVLWKPSAADEPGWARASAKASAAVACDRSMAAGHRGPSPGRTPGARAIGRSGG